ncbi:TetR/AcrR family transcriptional regulator [Fructilactobacillus florum]|uniref:TetR/AcrR family transcriptional regulator n=1 Tax=Fructilactobacillus florum TaxID=640331 RepID=UPI0034E2BC26
MEAFKKQILVKKLLQTAIKLFKLNGIKAVKTGEIAQNAGVSTGTFYVHFKSKEEIISAIYYDSFNDFMQERLKTLNVNAESLTQLLIKIGNFEFNFVDQVGREVTTNAFSANLMTNYEHPGHHLESRTFPAKIKTIIAKKRCKKSRRNVS